MNQRIDNHQYLRLARKRHAAGGRTLLSRAEVARLLALNESHLYQWVRAGKIHEYGPQRHLDLGEALSARDRSMSRPPNCPLTFGQLHVLQMLADGCTLKQINSRLGRSNRYSYDALCKMRGAVGAPTNENLVAVGLRNDWIAFPE